MLRPHSPTMREGPTPCKGWAHLQGGQRSVSLEYQTCTSAYLFDTLVTGKARPGDVFIRRWSDGKDAALDVTVTSPLASSNLADATACPGGALEKAYDRKMRDTADACRQQGLVFLPIALETLGGMHHLAVNQLKRLGAALARHTGSDEREVVSQLMQKISLHLMRGNAAMITSRRPDVDFLPPEMDGVE